jgi:hypothetical protein
MSAPDVIPPLPLPLLAAHAPPARPGWLAALLDPASLLTRSFGGLGPLAALTVSGMAFATISLQAALDLYRIGMFPPGGALLVVLRGALLGTLGVALVGLIAHALTRALGAARPLLQTLSAVALAYGGALVYGLVGLALNLTLGWATAVSSGLTGLLWSLGPLFAVLRELSGGRAGVAATLATLGGSALLFGWFFVGVGR